LIKILEIMKEAEDFLEKVGAVQDGHFARLADVHLEPVQNAAPTYEEGAMNLNTAPLKAISTEGLSTMWRSFGSIQGPGLGGHLEGPDALVVSVLMRVAPDPKYKARQVTFAEKSQPYRTTSLTSTQLSWIYANKGLVDAGLAEAARDLGLLAQVAAGLYESYDDALACSLAE
jgi:hypothetical protein